MIKRLLGLYKNRNDNTFQLIKKYHDNGRVAWSVGYAEYKESFITESISNLSLLNDFKISKRIKDFGIGLDERCVEYPWVLSRIGEDSKMLLDAGSTFNYEYILNSEVLRDKNLIIYTYFPESHCFYQKKVSYVFGDLREMCFNQETFDLVVCQSTLEHIDMDNSIYGYGRIEEPRVGKSYEYIKAINEMLRVLKSKGKLLITVPFGKFENHGFFQQFDKEMLERLKEALADSGDMMTTFFKYEKTGWRIASEEELDFVNSYNPHTGIGKGDDGAAHCRSIACVEFLKS